MKLTNTHFFALLFIALIGLIAPSWAAPNPTPQESTGYWDTIIIPRVTFEQMNLDACLQFAEYKCNVELKPQGAKEVVFEYHYDPKKAHEPVTLDLYNVTLPDLLRKICLPHNIAIEEKPGRLIFTDRK